MAYFNLPIALTWLRIVLIPLFVGVYYLPDSLLSMQGKNWLADGHLHPGGVHRLG